MTILIDVPARTASASERYMPAAEVRDHLLLLLSTDVTIQQVAGITGVKIPTIRAVIATPRTGVNRNSTIDRRVGELLLGVHSPDQDLPVNARVLAIGSKRRIQALVAMGWPIATIAEWANVTPDVLEALLSPSTVFVTARAHRAIVTVFRKQWGSVPTVKDPESVERARVAGWRTALAWDDIDLDVRPAATFLRSIHHDQDIVDDVAVELALSGTDVILSRAEREVVIARAHARELSDEGISILTGIPLGSVFRIRQELGLEPWGEFRTAAVAAA